MAFDPEDMYNQVLEVCLAPSPKGGKKVRKEVEKKATPIKDEPAVAPRATEGKGLWRN